MAEDIHTGAGDEPEQAASTASGAGIAFEGVRSTAGDSLSPVASGVRQRESVWDYPRPPRVEPERRAVRLELGDHLIAETRSALRVLETSHPPTIYVPMAAFKPGVLRDAQGASLCEFKGVARYHDLVIGELVVPAAGWSYPQPTAPFSALAGHVSIYPSKVDAAWLGDERVVAQPGDFYGGWITAELDGPFKGAPGTLGW